MDVLRLKMYREKANMTQRDVSQVLDISQAAYWNWEKGIASPSPKQIMKLCDLYQCTPNDLFGIKEKYSDAMNKLDQ